MKTPSTFLLAVLLMGAFAPSAFADKCQDGKAALDRGDAQAAILLLRDAVRKDKKNAECHTWLGMALLAADSADEAVAVLIQARELDPENAGIYILMGDAYGKQNIHAMAIQQYQQALTLDSANVGVWKKKAESHMKMRQYTEAGTAYRKAIDLDSSDLNNYRALSNLYMRAELYPQAVPLLQQIVARDPDAAAEKIQLLKALAETRRYEELIPVANSILESNGTQNDSLRTEVLRQLGIAYVKMKDPENAVRIFTELEKLNALAAADYVELGKAHRSLDQVDEAIAAFEKAYQADSTLGDIYYDLGTLYMKKKNFPAAAAMFEKKIEADTSAGFRFASHLNAAVSLMQVKEFERARVHILESLFYRPDYLQAWLTLAQNYAQLDSTKQLREAYRKVVELALSDTTNSEKSRSALDEAYRTEGFYLLLDKRYPESIDSFKRALQIDPKNCQTLLWIAQAYTLSNVREDAERFYCRVVQGCGKNDPRYKDAVKGLEALGKTAETCGK